MVTNAAQLLLDIDEEINKINQYMTFVRKDNQDLFFADLSINRGGLRPAHFGFYRMVSWLYVLYYETAKTNIKYMLEIAQKSFPDKYNPGYSHYDSIRKLRTYNEHSLNSLTGRDTKVITYCQEWFTTYCGLPLPDCEEHWERCLIGILQESLRFITMLKECILFIQNDPGKSMYLDQWATWLNRHHPGYTFDPLIMEAMSDWGRVADEERIVKFRNRYLQKWQAKLATLPPGYQFAEEARKLIDHSLLLDSMDDLLPITSKDIIRECDINTGILVAHLSARAFVLYHSGTREPNELLVKLREISNDLKRSIH